MGSNVRNPSVRSHLFVQSGQDGCECCECCKGLDGQIVESVVSLAIVCKFLSIVTVNSLPMSEKELQCGECLFLSVVFVRITSY